MGNNIKRQSVVRTMTVQGREFEIELTEWTTSDGLSYDVIDGPTGKCLTEESYDSEPDAATVSGLLDRLRDDMDNGTLGGYYDNDAVHSILAATVEPVKVQPTKAQQDFADQLVARATAVRNAADGFVQAWLRPGDEMRSGGVVPDGRVGLRLHGDIEVTGTAEQLMDLGNRIVSTYDDSQVTERYVMIRGFTSEEQVERLRVAMNMLPGDMGRWKGNDAIAISDDTWGVDTADAVEKAIRWARDNGRVHEVTTARKYTPQTELARWAATEHPHDHGDYSDVQ